MIGLARRVLKLGIVLPLSLFKHVSLQNTPMSDICIYIYVCMYMFIYIYICTYENTYMCVRAFCLNQHTYMHTYIPTRVHSDMHA